MVASGMDARFFESTRGRIVEILRRGEATVDELARALALTPNAVRLHLGTLERDDIVRARGVRRDGTVGKPAGVYEINPDAEPGFSRAYLPFLSTLLVALGERLSARELKSVMRDVGHRLAGDQGTSAATIAERTQLASDILNALGGVTTVERADDGALSIRGCSCPLSVAVAERPEVCVAVQTMLRDVIGAPVREECDRSDRPRCCFAIEQEA